MAGGRIGILPLLNTNCTNYGCAGAQLISLEEHQTAGEGDDWLDEKVWIKANPNLGVSKKWDDVRRKARRALEIGSAISEHSGSECVFEVGIECMDSVGDEVDQLAEMGGVRDGCGFPLTTCGNDRWGCGGGSVMGGWI